VSLPEVVRQVWPRHQVEPGKFHNAPLRPLQRLTAGNGDVMRPFGRDAEDLKHTSLLEQVTADHSPSPC
jgi:hypothetical protein